MIFVLLLFVSAEKQAYAVETTDVVVSLSSDGPFELIINGKSVKRADQAKLMKIKVSINSGVNNFFLILHNGTAAIHVKAPGLDINGIGWEIASVNAPFVNRYISIDEFEWESVTKVSEDSSLGPIVGKPMQSVILRRIILWKKTRVWPSPSPAFYLPENGTLPMNFIIDGVINKKLKNWTTYLAMPSGIECLGSSSFYVKANPQQSVFTMTRLGKIQIDGQSLDYYSITADKPIDSSKHIIAKIMQIFLRCKDSMQKEREEMNIIYWSEANSGSVIENKQSIPVKIIKKINGKQPSKFVFQLCGGFFSVLDDLQMRNEILKTAQLAGFNYILCNDYWCSDRGSRLGIKTIADINFESWSINLSRYLKSHPNSHLLRYDGMYSDHQMCTTKLLEEGWPYVEQVLKELIEKMKPNVIDYDYEYSPFNGPHSCYCPICLDQFRKFAGLSGKQKLSSEIIKENYNDQWVDFMARRVASIFSLLGKSIHRLSPETQFTVYSGCQTYDNPKRYGVDWRYIGELHAVDKAGCGYKQNVAIINKTLEALKGIPLVGGVIVTPYDINSTDPPKELTPALILRQLFDSAGGILAYSYMEMGGLSWQAIGEVSRFVAAYEDVILSGKRFGLPGYDNAMVQAIKKRTTFLICVMNNRLEAETISVNLPERFIDGYEFYSNSKIDPRKPINCMVNPGEIKIFIMKN
jgi:hypothetical protein